MDDLEERVARLEAILRNLGLAYAEPVPVHPPLADQLQQSISRAREKRGGR